MLCSSPWLDIQQDPSTDYPLLKCVGFNQRPIHKESLITFQNTYLNKNTNVRIKTLNKTNPKPQISTASVKMFQFSDTPKSCARNKRNRISFGYFIDKQIKNKVVFKQNMTINPSKLQPSSISTSKFQLKTKLQSQSLIIPSFTNIKLKNPCVSSQQLPNKYTFSTEKIIKMKQRLKKSRFNLKNKDIQYYNNLSPTKSLNGSPHKIYFTKQITPIFATSQSDNHDIIIGYNNQNIQKQMHINPQNKPIQPHKKMIIIKTFKKNLSSKRKHPLKIDRLDDFYSLFIKNQVKLSQSVHIDKPIEQNLNKNSQIYTAIHIET